VASPLLHYEGSANPIKISLLPNPSHLGESGLLVTLAHGLDQVKTEAVNPVALGKARAKQYSLLKTSSQECRLGDRVMCVQLHGDASFTGQGVVMETLGLSEHDLAINYDD
jgi:probable 2-oxoglutarate dehydrogenase E1 component DHKTD1